MCINENEKDKRLSYMDLIFSTLEESYRKDMLQMKYEILSSIKKLDDKLCYIQLNIIDLKKER